MCVHDSRAEAVVRKRHRRSEPYCVPTARDRVLAAIPGVLERGGTRRGDVNG